MKYNRREIMKAAWTSYKMWSFVYKNYTFSMALKHAWESARKQAEREALRNHNRYDVVGTMIFNGKEHVIARDVDSDTAARIKYDNRLFYNFVEVRKIA